MHFQASQQVAKHLYDIKVQPSTLLPKQIGNMYTASLYAALASVIYNKHNSLVSFVSIPCTYVSSSCTANFCFLYRLANESLCSHTAVA